MLSRSPSGCHPCQGLAVAARPGATDVAARAPRRAIWAMSRQGPFPALEIVSCFTTVSFLLRWGFQTPRVWTLPVSPAALTAQVEGRARRSGLTGRHGVQASGDP